MSTCFWYEMCTNVGEKWAYRLEMITECTFNYYIFYDFSKIFSQFGILIEINKF